MKNIEELQFYNSLRIFATPTKYLSSQILNLDPYSCSVSSQMLWRKQFYIFKIYVIDLLLLKVLFELIILGRQMTLFQV